MVIMRINILSSQIQHILPTGMILMSCKYFQLRGLTSAWRIIDTPQSKGIFSLLPILTA
jgi:hypothetical protein